MGRAVSTGLALSMRVSIGVPERVGLCVAEVTRVSQRQEVALSSTSPEFWWAKFLRVTTFSSHNNRMSLLNQKVLLLLLPCLFLSTG